MDHSKKKSPKNVYVSQHPISYAMLIHCLTALQSNPSIRRSFGGGDLLCPHCADVPHLARWGSTTHDQVPVNTIHTPNKIPHKVDVEILHACQGDASRGLAATAYGGASLGTVVSPCQITCQ